MFHGLIGKKSSSSSSLHCIPYPLVNVYITMESGPVEIVDVFPSKNIRMADVFPSKKGIFRSYVAVYQRVSSRNLVSNQRNMGLQSQDDSISIYHI